MSRKDNAKTKTKHYTGLNKVLHRTEDLVTKHDKS